MQRMRLLRAAAAAEHTNRKPATHQCCCCCWQTLIARRPLTAPEAAPSLGAFMKAQRAHVHAGAAVGPLRTGPKELLGRLCQLSVATMRAAFDASMLRSMQVEAPCVPSVASAGKATEALQR